jgi:virginiamycin B lyase
MNTKTITCLLSLAMLLSIAAADYGNVRIQEWELPQANSLPHDPAVAPDGSLWYTAMRANRLGRLDPKTGKLQEYPLKMAGSAPHGLAADKEGNIWFTANAKGYIGRLNPVSGALAEFPLPDRAAKDPHTLVFDGSGRLWFTVQNGNFVGRLEPSTGKITLKRLASRGSLPYGMAVNSRGIPYFCEFGANRIGRLDPKTLAVTEYKLPKGARPRRLAIYHDDTIWYTDYGRGYLGHLDPASGKVREWPAPSGPDSFPYAIADTPDGALWFCETGVEPNKMVRFDPKTEKFDSWIIPSGGGTVRNMAVNKEGDLYIACSGTNRVGVVWTGSLRAD